MMLSLFSSLFAVLVFALLIITLFHSFSSVEMYHPYARRVQSCAKLPFDKSQAFKLIAALKNKLYVGLLSQIYGNVITVNDNDWTSNAIRVYNSDEPYKQLKKTVVENVKGFREFVASPVNSCVYILSDDLKIIRMSSKYKAVVWRKDPSIVNISVTDAGSLICLTQDPGTMRANQSPEIIMNLTYCKIYNDKNEVTVEVPFEFAIRLNPPIVDFKQFFLTAERNLIVCYSVTGSQYMIGPVSISGNKSSSSLFETIKVDGVDKVARLYEIRNIPELQAVDLPSHFTRAKNGDFVVTFPENHQVVLIDKTLRLKRVLLTMEMSYQPVRVCINEEANKIFVSVKDGGVHVYVI